MKKYIYFLLIGSFIISECRTRVVKDYVIIIKPIGNSDVTRTTFYIALKKTNMKKENPFVDEILTDENSLRNVVSFVEDNRPAKNDSTNNAGWGSLEISEYSAKHLMLNYKLINKEQSRNYLRLLIRRLVNQNSDAKLIKLIGEDGLSEIN